MNTTGQVRMDGTSAVKRIAIVLPDLGGGGAERVHIELARQFLALGYAVEFVLLQARGDLLREVPQNATVTSLHAARFRSAFLPLRRHLKASRPDFVLAAMWPITALAILAVRSTPGHARIIVGEHIDFRSGSRESFLSDGLMTWMGRWIYRRADAVICVSAGARRALAAKTGLGEESIKLIYNPVAPPQIIPPLEQDDLAAWWMSARYPILSVGRLMEQKDQATLVEAIALLRKDHDVRLIILGEGPERPELEARVAGLDLNDHVRLPGFRRNVAAFLDKASLFVLSSRWEGAPMVIVEALLQGVPVVSTNCPSGPDELLGDGRYGRLVPVGEAQALADAMAASLGEPRDPEMLRRRGRDFDPRIAALRYLACLDPAISLSASQGAG